MSFLGIIIMSVIGFGLYSLWCRQNCNCEEHKEQRRQGDWWDV